MQIIITGHGQYAFGMVSALRMVVGMKDNIHMVKFGPEDSTETYRERLVDVLESSEESILILCDLSGGTPFKQAVLARHDHPKKVIEVIGGVNLAMLMEIALSTEDPTVLADDTIRIGQKAMLHYKPGIVSLNSQQDTGI